MLLIVQARLNQARYLLSDVLWLLLDLLFAPLYALSFENPGEEAFFNRLDRWKTRQDRRGATLRVILSLPAEEQAVIAMYHLASLSIAGVQDSHLPILLWYRNLLQRDAVQRNSVLRRALLQTMLRLEAADVWPEPNIDSVEEMIQQWRALLAAKTHAARGEPA
jgi:hypothetical protein